MPWNALECLGYLWITALISLLAPQCTTIPTKTGRHMTSHDQGVDYAFSGQVAEAHPLSEEASPEACRAMCQMLAGHLSGFSAGRRVRSYMVIQILKSGKLQDL